VPAVAGGVGEAVDDAEHAGDFGGEAGQVQPWPRPGWLPAQQQDRPGAGGGREDEVDVQAPAPVQVLGQQPAEQQADRAPAGRPAAAGCRTPGSTR